MSSNLLSLVMNAMSEDNLDALSSVILILAKLDGIPVFRLRLLGRKYRFLLFELIGGL